MTNPERSSPTGWNLLDQESREKLPELYSGEELGMDALAEVKYFTHWLASAKSSLRQKSWQQYRQIVRDDILPALGRIKVVDLRPDLIQALYDCKVDDGVGLRTIRARPRCA